MNKIQKHPTVHFFVDSRFQCHQFFDDFKFVLPKMKE